MSFAIDANKVEELLASTPLGYEVSPISSVTVTIDNYAPLYPDLAGGTMAIGTREHLLTLRRRIEESGIPLISADGLDSEIREMRR